MTVDEFIQAKVRPEFWEIVEMLRGLVREVSPSAVESLSYGIPAYRLRLIFAVISPTQKDITFSFSRGAQMEDAYGLLRGAGKSSKHVKIKSLETANLEALRYYLRQAVELDAK